MSRRLSSGWVVAVAVLAGCGGGTSEIAPTEGKGQVESQAVGMEESMKHMPPDQQAKMKAQMDKMKQQQQSGPQ